MKFNTNPKVGDMVVSVPMVCTTCRYRFVGGLDVEELRCPECNSFVVFDNETYMPPKKHEHYSDHHLNSPLFAPIDWVLHHRRRVRK